jgi:hypothetical protein
MGALEWGDPMIFAGSSDETPWLIVASVVNPHDIGLYGVLAKLGGTFDVTVEGYVPRQLLDPAPSQQIKNDAGKQAGLPVALSVEFYAAAAADQEPGALLPLLRPAPYRSVQRAHAFRHPCQPMCRRTETPQHYR